MDILEIITKLWPIAAAFVGLVIVLAKMDNRVAVLEEKVRVLFELHNASKK
jgi:hypothetical protein